MTENAFQSQLLYLRTVTRASAFRTQITCFIGMYTTERHVLFTCVPPNAWPGTFCPLQ